MIDETKTFILFRYTSDTLKTRSHKKVWKVCDICGEERLIRYNDYSDLCKSCSQKGNHHSKETKHKMSIAQLGDKNPMFGKHPSEETKRKISKNHADMSGKNNPNFGKHHTEETKCKMSKNHADMSGDKSPLWKGGKKMTMARNKSKRRRLFGFIPHNKPHKNFHGHHLDFNHVIFIPAELHRSISHSVVNNKNMDLINDVACDWYLEYQII